MQTSSILCLNWTWCLLASRSHRSGRWVGSVQWGHLGSPGSRKSMHRATQSAIGKVCVCTSSKSSSSQASGTVRFWPHISSLDNWLQLSTCCGCQRALLQFKLHLSLGTSQLCHCFVAILQWEPVLGYLQTALAREAVRTVQNSYKQKGSRNSHGEVVVSVLHRTSMVSIHKPQEPPVG